MPASDSQHTHDHASEASSARIARLTAEVERLTKRVVELETRSWLETFPHENPDPILACRKDGQIAYMNPAAERIIESLDLSDPYQFLPADHTRVVHTCINTNRTLVTFKHVMEREYEWLYHGVPATGICHLYAHDVTERRRAEEVLRDSERWFRAVVENLSEGLLVTDMKERIVYLNQRMAEMCGYTPNNLVNTPAELLWPEDFRADVAHRTEGRHSGQSERYESQLLTKDGRRIYVKVSAAPYRDSSGRITGCFGVFTDITDLKRAEEEREKLESQLRRTQKLETIGTLAGGIAHDFNNILTPILGYADMARLDLPAGGVAHASIEHVIQAAYRAKDLVKQILTFSRQVDQERKPLKLHPVVKEALKLLRASIPSTIDIRENIDPGCGYVLAEPSQIHQVLMNLCTNAFHAMRETGGVLEVSLATISVDEQLAQMRPSLHEGRYVRLSVGDTGKGMSREVIDRIFEPFFTTKQVGEGTGLGLSVVHGIVVNHGGDISVYSEPGQGTTFNVYLPVVKDELDARAVGEQTVLKGSEHVLFVDDDREITDMGQQMLERLGYRVTTKTSSREALEAFRAAPEEFDIVITDQTMPQMTGCQLVRELLALRPDLPIILITGFSETISGETFGKFGIREFVMKPIVLHDLSVTVRRALDGQRAGESAARSP